jgi:uncharacterized protein YukE
MRIAIPNDELRRLLDREPEAFPKYATQIINLANQNAQGTRPKIVGQQTELIQQFPGDTLEEWEIWYQERYPDAIQEATTRIYRMVEQLRATMAQIDEPMVERWVRDLIFVKTFIGLRFQEAILRKVAEQNKTSYRSSTQEEEARGIDGYIGERPVSIKPDTYRTKASLPEVIGVDLIYYTKQKDGIVIEYEFAP